MAKTIRVGIATMGGDSPGLNAAIRGFGKTAITHYGIELVGFVDGVQGLVNDRTIPLDAHALSGILATGGTMLGTSRDKPHRMVIDGETRNMIPTIAENCRRNKLDGLVLLGGGGTAKNALRLAESGINVLTMPKTIDNDIAETDTSFGFATATDIATEAVDRVHTTAHSHHRIILTEIMGNKVGWLTLGAGLAGGADTILIPEIPYSIDTVAAHIRQRIEWGSSFSVVAIAEGARSLEVADRIETAQRAVETARGSVARGVAKQALAEALDNQREHSFALARQLEALTGLEARVSILGYVQRGGGPGAQDRILATTIGSAAARHVSHGEWGIMVAARGDGTAPVPLEDVAGRTKFVPLDHQWLRSARNIGVSLGD